MTQKINTRVQIFAAIAVFFTIMAFCLLQEEYKKYRIRLEEQRQQEQAELELKHQQEQAALKLKIEIKKTQDQVDKISSSNEDPEVWKNIQEFDSWETLIEIKIVDGALHKGEVRSAGPDKDFDTTDDIIASRIDFSAINVGVKIGETGTDLTKGLLKGVHRSLFKKKE